MSVYCPACHSQDLDMLFDMGYQPMSLTALQTDPGASDALERYRIRLAICYQCGHVHNIDFNPNNIHYQNGCRMFNNGADWKHHVNRVRNEVENTAAEGCFCEDDVVIEVGAGDCKFLDSLQLFEAQRLAIDPAYESEVAAQELGIPHIRDKFVPSEHIPDGAETVTVVMRHLLEHMEHPRDFIESICNAANTKCQCLKLVIEVPCIDVALKRGRIEDWTYEHPQHFSYESMHKLLAAAGCQNIEVYRSYGGEVLIASATYYPRSRTDIACIVGRYKGIDEGIEFYSDWFNRNLDSIAFWGGAGKSAMFLRKFKVGDEALVVDSHNEKWGMYVPGTRIQMVPPTRLFEGEPRIVVATTSWRALDIAKEIKAHKLPCIKVLKFEGGELLEVHIGD